MKIRDDPSCTPRKSDNGQNETMIPFLEVSRNTYNSERSERPPLSVKKIGIHSRSIVRESRKDHKDGSTSDSSRKTSGDS